MWRSTLIPHVHPHIISTMSRCAFGNLHGLGGTALSSAAWPSANLSVLFPFRLDTPAKVAFLWWVNGTITANPDVDVGIYNLDGRLLVSTGATAAVGNATLQGVTLGTPVTLPPWTYYLAMACSSSNPSFYHMAAPTAGVSSLKLLGAAQVASNMALGTLVTLATYTGTRIPVFGLADGAL